MATKCSIGNTGVVKSVAGSVLTITPQHGCVHGPKGDITTNTSVPGGSGLTQGRQVSFDADSTGAITSIRA